MNRTFFIFLFFICFVVYCNANAETLYKTTLSVHINNDTIDYIILTDGTKKGNIYVKDEYLEIIDIDSVLHTYKRFKVNKLAINSVVTSIEDSNSISIVVSPNPATDELYLTGIEDEKIHITIYSLPGELLIQKEIFSTDKVDISMLSAGSYFIKIKEHILRFTKI